MATVDENIKVWNDAYDWPGAGDEWSAEFGGTEALWFFVLYPRLHRLIPAPTILEIAPGFGRWTGFLKNYCQSMIAIDLSEKCIEYCKTRFESDKHIAFHVNDGTSLAAVPDGSVDFVFSFDSLVHAESDVIRSYLSQLATKLTPDGIGFIHHSNIGAYPGRLALLNYYGKLPRVFRTKVLTKGMLSDLASINLQAFRAKSMTADLFRKYCQESGLKCIHQELINWKRGKALVDAISIFTRPNSRWDDKGTFMNNPQFARNAVLISRLANLYCR